MLDLANKEFGLLVAIEPTEKRDKDRSIIWKCKCECGNICYVSSHKLMQYSIKSCGCYRKKFGKQLIKKCRDTNFRHHTSIGLIKSDRIPKNNTSGIKGVSWIKQHKKWRAQITFQSKSYNLGEFKEMQDAINTRKDAETRIREYLDAQINEVLLSREDVLKILGLNREEPECRGVHKSSKNRWLAEISYKGKRTRIGLFANKKDAIEARKRAEKTKELAIKNNLEYLPI